MIENYETVEGCLTRQPTTYSTGFSWCPSTSTLLHAIVQRLRQ